MISHIYIYIYIYTTKLIYNLNNLTKIGFRFLSKCLRSKQLKLGSKKIDPNFV